MFSRSISTEADFRDTVQMCSGNDKQELIPVDKLHYFQDESVTTIDGDENGLFRVNAINHNGKWYKYSSGDLQEIDFNHFEDFDVNEGENGWYQKSDSNPKR